MSELPKDYFLDIDDEMLEYLEKNAEGCIQEMNDSNNKNKENGYKLLNLLMVGIGSSFLLLTKEREINYFSVCLFVFMMLWIFSAGYLVLCVLKVHKRGTIKTSPDFLYTPEFKALKDDGGFYKDLQENGFHSCEKLIDVIRRRRLMDLCENIDKLESINNAMGKRLTGVTIFSVAAPVISFLFLFFSFSDYVLLIL